MSNLPNSAIRLVPPSFRDGYCPASWTAFAQDIISGTSAQPSLRKGTTFYNFGSTAPYPPEPTPPTPEPACQDFLIDWEPAGDDISPGVSFYVGQDGFFPNLDGVETISFNAETLGPTSYFQLSSTTTLLEAHFPNLTQTPPQIFIIENNAALTLVSFPALITSVAFTSVIIAGNSLLSEISVPSLVPVNHSRLRFNGNALSQACVDAILSRCVASAVFVSGILQLEGGTNATPSASGLADKATLLARGVTVTTN